jgi:hypothetical protein
MPTGRLIKTAEQFYNNNIWTTTERMPLLEMTPSRHHHTVPLVWYLVSSLKTTYSEADINTEKEDAIRSKGRGN